MAQTVYRPPATDRGVRTRVQQMTRIRSTLFGLALTVVCPAIVLAATPPTPGTVLERGREMRDFLEQQRQLQSVPQAPGDVQIRDETGDTDVETGGDETRFVLQQVAFSKSAVLADDELREVAARYVGREVSVRELFELVAEINALYRERRIIAAKAVLPPQRIDQGRVSIRLVEGKVGRLLLDGNETTDDAFIADGLPTLQRGSLVYLDALESDLLYFNAVNDVDLRAVLKPGETFGTTDYVLRVDEPPPRDTALFLDTAGQDDIGLYRIGITHTERSLTGGRDILQLGGYWAEGTRSLYGVYDLPLNSRGTRLALSVDYSAIDIIDGPLEPLDVSGDSINVGLYLTHPIDVTRQGVSNAFVGYNYKESSTEFDDVTLFETFVRSVSLGVDTTRSRIDRSWFGRVSMTGAPDTWGNTDSFLRLNGEYSSIRVLQKNNWVWLLRARAQWTADDLLPPSEQFQIGGMSTVRGYPEGLLIGDEGYFISAEFTFPVTPAYATDLTSNPFTQRYRGILFIDHGGAFPFKGNDEGIEDDDFLTSVGGGLNINLDRNTQGRLVLGFPLQSRDDDEDHPTLHFYIQRGIF